MLLSYVIRLRELKWFFMFSMLIEFFFRRWFVMWDVVLVKVFRIEILIFWDVLNGIDIKYY